MAHVSGSNAGAADAFLIQQAFDANSTAVTHALVFPPSGRLTDGVDYAAVYDAHDPMYESRFVQSGVQTTHVVVWRFGTGALCLASMITGNAGETVVGSYASLFQH